MIYLIINSIFYTIYDKCVEVGLIFVFKIFYNFFTLIKFNLNKWAIIQI